MEIFLWDWFGYSLSDDLESGLLWGRLTSDTGSDLELLVCCDDFASSSGDLVPALLPWVDARLDALGSGWRAENLELDVLGGLEPAGLSGEDSELSRDSSSDEDCELALDFDRFPLGCCSGEDSERSLKDCLLVGGRSEDSLGLVVDGSLFLV